MYDSNRYEAGCTNETLNYPIRSLVGANWITYNPSELGKLFYPSFLRCNVENTTANQYYYSSASSNVDTSLYSRNLHNLGKSHLLQQTMDASNKWCEQRMACFGRRTVHTASAAQNVGPTARFGYGKGPESAHIMWTNQLGWRNQWIRDFATRASKQHTTKVWPLNQ